MDFNQIVQPNLLRLFQSNWFLLFGLIILVVVIVSIVRQMTSAGSPGAVPRPQTAGDAPQSLSQDQSLLIHLNILKTRYQQPILAALTFDGKCPDFLWATLEWGTNPRMTYDHGAAVAIFRESKLIRVILDANTSKPSPVLAISFGDVVEIQRSQVRPQPGHAYEHFTTLFSRHKIYNQLSFGDTYQDLYAALRIYLPNVPVTVG